MSLALALIVLVTGVDAKRYYDSLSGDCVSNVGIVEDFHFFPESFQLEGKIVKDGVEIQVADDFRVFYDKNYKVVENLRVNESYVLYQCGTKPPDLSDYPPNVKLFEIPLTSIALYDVTSSSFLAELGIQDRVKFASAYATDPCLQKISHKCEKVAQAPEDEFSDPNLLRKQSRRTDAVFISQSSNHSKSIAFTSTMDPAVLNRAEWVKFISLFFNKEPEANAFFEEILAEWDAFKMPKKANGPRVAWISYSDYFIPQFFIHFAEYKTEYIVAAGGSLLGHKKLRSIKSVKKTFGGYMIEIGKKRSLAFDALHQVLEDVDIVIDETYQVDNAAYDIEEFYKLFGLTKKSPFEFVKNQKVFRLDGIVGNSTFGTDSLDWYETAVARPNWVLKDLQMAFETRKHRRWNRMWLRNLSKGELPKRLTHKDCESFKYCRAKPEPICPTVFVSCLGDVEYRNVTDQQCPSINCDG